ncbi:MAG: DUF169 domain-containing protein [Dehalococcoidales bacterium]|nr:DUF169 domain-containing protein [Dehalococcoidales bacterium]
MKMINELDSTSRKLQQYLGMDTLPVGIKLVIDGEQAESIPYDKTDNRGPFCRYVHEASRGKNFLIALEDLDCNKAEIVIGFKEPRFANIEPRVKEKVTAIRIGPAVDADVVMLVLNAAQAMTLSNLLPEIKLSFRKNRTVCGEGLAAVYNTKLPTMTLLCIGARTDGNFEPEELLVTLPCKTFLELPSKMNKFASLSRQAVDSLRSRFNRLH